MLYKLLCLYVKEINLIFKQLYNYIPCNDINFVIKKHKIIEVELLKDSFFEQTLYDNLLKQYIRNSA